MAPIPGFTIAEQEAKGRAGREEMVRLLAGPYGLPVALATPSELASYGVHFWVRLNADTTPLPARAVIDDVAAETGNLFIEKSIVDPDDWNLVLRQGWATMPGLPGQVVVFLVREWENWVAAVPLDLIRARLRDTWGVRAYWQYVPTVNRTRTKKLWCAKGIPVPATTVAFLALWKSGPAWGKHGQLPLFDAPQEKSLIDDEPLDKGN